MQKKPEKVTTALSASWGVGQRLLSLTTPENTLGKKQIVWTQHLDPFQKSEPEGLSKVLLHVFIALQLQQLPQTF